MSHVPTGFPSGGKLTAAVMDIILRKLPTVIAAGPGLEIRKHARGIVLSATRAKRTPGGGGRGCKIVAALPPIPSSGYLCVVWGNSTMIDGGTGDGQEWGAASTDTRFFPKGGKPTAKSGTPV